jgi:aspartyl-tRNA(Asn)/glutamyl-tRNA(Gln) amidotransferase subunit C
MQLKPEDVQQLARLAQLAIDDQQAQETLTQLNQVFGLIEKMQAVDTTGIEPMSHPQPDPARLREDRVTEVDQRDKFQQVAPSTDSGLYLVPKVIE